MRRGAALRHDGIYTPDDLRARCSVQPNGCWLWLGACDTHGRPSAWHPDLKAHVSLGMFACFWAERRRPLKGEAWHVKCTTPNCGNPEHRICGNRSSQMLAARVKRTPEQRARMAAGRSRISERQVDEIRRSTSPLVDLAQTHGISEGWASSIRTGKARMSSGPFGSLGIGRYIDADSAVSRAYA